MDYLAVIDKVIASERERLVELSRAIFANPELSGQEFFACRLLSEYLEQKGFNITREIAGLPTAFTARYQQGESGYHLAFLAEYDALPEIGHGCGHNLIGMASVAAAVAVAGSVHNIPFRVTLVGTPDEERCGGKVDLVRAGIFNDVHVAMMFHPGCSTVIDVQTLACRDFEFVFHGRNAHAACDPWEGRNALEAVILMFNAINALRQHVKDDVRIHGIITEGGLASNVVPERAVAQITVRSLENVYLEELVERVKNCARGAALATGTTVDITESNYPYDAMLANRTLAGVFEESLRETGYRDPGTPKEGMGSIDMGNVSRVVPAIHPVLAIVDRTVTSHTAEFAALCDTPRALEVTFMAARAMAVTGLKVLHDPRLQQEIRREFQAASQRRQA